MLTEKTGDKMMGDKEKAECLIELCKIQLYHFRQTRNIEFKINLALWTLIVLGGGNLFYGNVKLDNCCKFVSYIVFASVIVLAHFFFWMRPIQNSELRDLRFTYQCRSKIKNLIGDQSNNSQNNGTGEKWIYFEVAITFLLLVGVGIVLSL